MALKRFSVKVFHITPAHTYLYLYINGALCVSTDKGVCLRNSEVEDFLRRMRPDFVDWAVNEPVPKWLEPHPDAPLEGLFYQLKIISDEDMVGLLKSGLGL